MAVEVGTRCKIIRVLMVDLDPLVADLIVARASRHEMTFVDRSTKTYDVVLTSPEQAARYRGVPVVAVSARGDRLEVNDAQLEPAQIVAIIRDAIDEGGSPWRH
jgi:hypothetical protein